MSARIKVTKKEADALREAYIKATLGLEEQKVLVDFCEKKLKSAHKKLCRDHKSFDAELKSRVEEAESTLADRDKQLDQLKGQLDQLQRLAKLREAQEKGDKLTAGERRRVQDILRSLESGTTLSAQVADLAAIVNRLAPAPKVHPLAEKFADLCERHFPGPINPNDPRVSAFVSAAAAFFDKDGEVKGA